MAEAAGVMGTPAGEATARAPGTCGELAQGLLGDAHFHITLPIDVYSRVTVTFAEGAGDVTGPEDSPKAVAAVRLTLKHLGLPGRQAAVRVEDPLPRGKGMASSTADVAAAIAATAAASGRSFTPEDIAALALQVEPSDGLMFPGIVLFDHRNGRLRESLGTPPPMLVLVLEFEGAVDTLDFNRLDLTSALRKREARWRESVALIREGIAKANVALVGEGATLDSLAFSEVVPKPALPAALALAKETGAAGVNIAHSGTVVGLLFAPDEQRVAFAAARATQKLADGAGLERAYQSQVVGGGIHLLSSQPLVRGTSAPLQELVR